MDKPIQPWEAEVDEGSATPTPKPVKKPVPPKPKTVPVGQTEVDGGSVGKKKGGCVKMAKGGSVSSRADGCATKGKTKGRFV